MALARALLVVLLLAPWPAAIAAEGPLVITGDAQLQARAAASGWRGTGSASDPIVIGPLEASATTGAAVLLQNTSLHVRLDGVKVAGSGRGVDGIRLEGVANVVVQDADLEFNRACVVLAPYFDGRTETLPRDVTIRDSRIRACAVGVSLDRATGVTVTNNTISVSDEDVRLSRSSHNVFQKNNLSVASGQVGFSFQDESSYNNTIDESNVVNFVPVRWYVEVNGTSAARRAISGVEADVKGMTNVAQVMCYRCQNVTFEAPRAASGIAAGIAVVRGANVSVVDPVVEGNKAAGVYLVHTRNVVVRGLTGESDGTDLNATSSDNLTLEASTGSNAGEAALVLMETQDVNVTGWRAYGAPVGIWIDRSARVDLTDVDASENRGDGVRVSFSRNVTISNSSASRNAESGVVVTRSPAFAAIDLRADGNRVDGLRAAASPDLLVRRMRAEGNGGSGVDTSDATGMRVERSTFVNNTKAGVVAGSKTAASDIVHNLVRGDRGVGIWLGNAGPLVNVSDNTVSGHPANLRFTRSANNRLEGNVVQMEPGQVGLVFDDEASYENAIGRSNTVNGESVAWFVALAGTSRSPVEVRDVRVTVENMTNVAQVMLHKSSYVILKGIVATGGAARGVYIHRSSSIDLSYAEASGAQAGVEIRGSQSAAVAEVRASGGTAAVVVADTTNASLARITATASPVALLFADKTSRGAVVSDVDASGVTSRSVVDPTFTPGPPPRSHHLVVDAGLDKMVAEGRPVVFADAATSARLGTERIARQTWDFGDGEGLDEQDDALLRPAHTYAGHGEFTATYSVETAAGVRISDRARVVVVPKSDPPPEVTASHSPRGVALGWKEPPPTRAPVVGYAVYRGDAPDNLTFLANATNLTYEDAEPLLTTAWYAVAARTTLEEGHRSAPLPLEPYLAPAPAELNATTGPAGSRLTWNASASAVPVLGYAVYRGESAENLTFLANATDVAFADAEPLPAPAWYAVAASTRYGEGARSAPLEVAPYAPPPPEPEPDAPAADEPADETPAAALQEDEAAAQESPLPAWVVLVALGLALATRRRR